MKQKRQLRIIELVNHNAIETQEELALRLREEGFAVTQATVSRDIRELNLTKMPCGSGRQKYTFISENSGGASDKYVRILHDGLISMEPAGNLLVLKTVSGMAMAVAAAIDAMHFAEVVGCIAGDDTIMAAVHTVQDGISLKNKINELIHAAL
ncbi:MAG: arginine repressor [Lachnospiraceae bacterium]|nr:arginine repressor [Lachnospiraceae bacterium]